VTSPIKTISEISVKIGNANNNDFDSKVIKKKKLDFSLSKIDKLVLKSHSPAAKKGDKEYELNHNFLVTL
jgi:hypothetical protein